MSEWKEVRLGDICDIYDGPHATPPKVESGFVFLGISSLGFDGRIDPAHFEYISEQTFKKWTRRIEPRYQDIVFSYETKLGVAAMIPKDFKCCLGRRTGLLRVKDGVEPRFLLYAYLAPDFQKTIHERTYHGSTVDRIPLKEMHDFPIGIPDPKEQKAIASVLSSLDDKIDLLHRQNKTLEAMAETFFRQWFVEEVREDWLPRGLLDVVQLVGGGTPKTSTPDYWDGDIPWLAGGDIAANHKSFVNDSEKKISEAGLSNSSARLLPQYSTVISARGTVGKYCLLAKPMAFSQSNYGILPNIGECFFFTYLLINHVVEELQSSAYGSVFDTITTNTFKDIKMPLPDGPVIEEFEEAVEPFFQKILTNKDQISTLEKFLDTLLPKLMSGEVRVEYEH